VEQQQQQQQNHSHHHVHRHQLLHNQQLQVCCLSFLCLIVIICVGAPTTTTMSGANQVLHHNDITNTVPNYNVPYRECHFVYCVFFYFTAIPSAMPTQPPMYMQQQQQPMGGYQYVNYGE
jgi:hypothetical protein